MNARFTGIFIPVEIMELDNLLPAEKMLLAIVDAYYDKTKGGCWASNEHLGQKVKMKANTVAKSLVKLRNMGLIEDVSFDGRIRVIRAKINKFIDECQSGEGLDYSPRGVGPESKGGWTIVQGGLDYSPTPTYIDIKVDKKEDNISIVQTSTSCGSDHPSNFCFSHEEGEFKDISDKDKARWKEMYPSIDVKREIMRAEEWLRSNPKKAKLKKKWRKFLTGWFNRENDEKENKQAYREMQGKSAKRTGMKAGDGNFKSADVLPDGW